MASWKEDVAPIGVFWRYGNWYNVEAFEYVTDQSIDSLSNNSLSSLHKKSLRSTSLQDFSRKLTTPNTDLYNTIRISFLNHQTN